MLKSFKSIKKISETIFAMIKWQCLMNTTEIITVSEVYTKVFKMWNFKVRKKYNKTFLSLQNRALFNYSSISLISIKHFEIT